MKLGKLIAAGAAIAAATSFYYTMAYVSRWEWNRAQMAGVFTVLAAVIAAGIMIDARLREVRQSLDKLAAQGGAPPAPPEQPPSPTRTMTDRQDFAWLTVKPERYGVFIPLLVGAGMLASGLAWAFERVFAGFAGLGRRRHSAPAGDRPQLPGSLVPPADTGFDAFADDLGGHQAGPGPTVADQAELWLRRRTFESAPIAGEAALGDGTRS